MATSHETAPDPLRPGEAAAAVAWAVRVQAQQAQVERLREVDEPDDFYAPMAQRFGQDPRRADDAALEALRTFARPSDAWLDIGSGGGRYSLPLALVVRRVHALDPSPSMLGVLRAGMVEHDIANIGIIEDGWPPSTLPPSVDVALMAHVGYDIEDFAAFLDAAEASASRTCIVIMRSGSATAAGHLLWREIHAESRVPYPMLEELVTLLLARGALPEITLVQRGTWGYESPEVLLEASRRQLWLRAGSGKDRRLQQIIADRASQRDGYWAVDWSPMQDGIVSWTPRR